MANVAYFPVVSIVQEGSPEPMGDKFGGRPLLHKDAPWPICHECHINPNLVFLCQLTNPLEAITYQIFSCPECYNSITNIIDYTNAEQFLRDTPVSYQDSDASDWYELPCFHIIKWEQGNKKGVAFYGDKQIQYGYESSILSLRRTYYLDWRNNIYIFQNGDVN